MKSFIDTLAECLKCCLLELFTNIDIIRFNSATIDFTLHRKLFRMCDIFFSFHQILGWFHFDELLLYLNNKLCYYME